MEVFRTKVFVWTFNSTTTSPVEDESPQSLSLLSGHEGSGHSREHLELFLVRSYLLQGELRNNLTAEASNILTMCRIGNVLCDSTQWGNILTWGDNKKARVLQPIGQRNHDPKLLITKDLSAKIALLSDSVCQPSTLGQGELLTKCTNAVVIVPTLLCANKWCFSFLIFNLSPPSDSRLPQSPPVAHCAQCPRCWLFSNLAF